MFQINYVLKHTIREPRPALPHGQREDGKLWEKFGMPSSHSQFIWYFAVYVTLFLLVRLHHQVHFQSWRKAFNKLTSLILFLFLNFYWTLGWFRKSHVRFLIAMVQNLNTLVFNRLVNTLMIFFREGVLSWPGRALRLPLVSVWLRSFPMAESICTTTHGPR